MNMSVEKGSRMNMSVEIEGYVRGYRESSDGVSNRLVVKTDKDTGVTTVKIEIWYNEYLEAWLEVDSGQLVRAVAAVCGG